MDANLPCQPTATLTGEHVMREVKTYISRICSCFRQGSAPPAHSWRIAHQFPEIEKMRDETMKREEITVSLHVE